MKAKLTRRIIATLLVLVMLLAILPSAFAGTFPDVPAGIWYEDAVEYCAENGLMSGTDKGFNPMGKVTREQVVQTLYALEEKPEVEYAAKFTDVADKQWYTSAILWAVDNGITSGTGDGKFGVGRNVTREQVALFLLAYAKLAGKDTSASAELDKFPDNAKADSWAVAALKWAVAEGFLSGKKSGEETLLAPLDELTRAELAVILANFNEYVAEPDTVDFEFLVTSDLHGQIYTTDYTAAAESAGTYKRGLTRIASYIKEQKAAYGDNVYTVDMGDSIQGAPMTYYYAFNKLDTFQPFPLALRAIGYDMWVVGNHEFNYGLPILNKQIADATAPAGEDIVGEPVDVCMANYLKAETNNAEAKDWATWNDFAPYQIKEFTDGDKTVKVAVIGFGNPNIPKWDIPSNWDGIYFADIIETYKHYEAEMLEKADMIVVVAHSGIGSDEGADFMERLVNATNTIAFAFSGHEHGNQVYMAKNSDGNDIPILQPYTKARAISQVDVSYNTADDSYTVDAKNIDMEGYAIDEELDALLKPYEEDAWNNYMLQPIGEALGDYPAANLGTAPSAFMDLINTVQLWGAYDRTGENTPDDTSDDTVAMLSISAPLTAGDNENLITTGPIMLGDMFGLYRFENWFYQIRMSGEEVHQWLEFAATKIQIVDGEPFVSDGDLTYYDIIFGDGFSYTIDYTKPEGERVVSMTYNGEEVAPDFEFTVVVNNYRYNGGGNYVAWLNDHGCEFIANDPDRIIYSTQFDMIQGEDEGQARTLLTRYIESETEANGGITPTITSTWKLETEPAGELEGKTVVLHTNDVHGAIEGYANVAALKADYEAKGATVILADAGDFSQGTTYVSLSKGMNAIDLMNLVGYDVATLGNHEFDYGYDQLAENFDKAFFSPICADILKDGENVFSPYFLHTDKITVGFVGLDTPEAQTKANPSLIQGLQFLTNDTEPALWAETRKQVDAAREAGADVVIGLVHLGVDEGSQPYTSYDLLKNVEGLDFVIDGHSHTVMEEGKDGEPIQSTGTALANVGAIIIDNETKAIEDSYLIPIWHTETVDDKEVTVYDYDKKDETVAAAAQEIIDAVEAEYGEVFATSEVELNGDKAPNGNRDSETNNGDLITDAMIWCVTEQYPGSITEVPAENVVAITNGGGIRAWIHKGDVTKNDILTVLPFGNTVTVVYVTGAELLEALEASTFCTPASLGGFPQVAGMKFTLDLNKDYDANAETYPGSTYYGPASVNRVTIDEINGKPFDPEAKYAVVTNDFCAGGGDTYYAFAAASSQFDTGYTLDAVVMDYIADKLEGVIPAALYEAPQDRITIIPKEVVEEWDRTVTIGDITLNVWFSKYGNTYTDCTEAHFTGTDDNGFGFKEGDIVTVKFLDQAIDLPVGTNYSDVDSGTPMIRINAGGYIELAINMGNFGSTYGLVDIVKGDDGNYTVTPKEGVTFPVQVTFELKEAQGYADELILHRLERSNDRAAYPDLTDEEFANFRQVTTTGMGDHLYRGSSPVNPEIARNGYADAAIEAAGVTVILNLADSEEIAKAYEGFADTYYSAQNVKYLNLGVDFTAADFKAGLADGLKFLAANEGTYYIHCTEGKDRAGFVNALLECLMGATYDEVVADYMVTYYNYYGVTTDDARYAPIANSNIIKTLCTAFGVEDLAAADLAAEAAEYLKEIGMTDEEIAALKANLADKIVPPLPPVIDGEIKVPSTAREGVQIPTYVSLPDDYDPDKTYDMVILIHGHGGNHNEWGGFDPITEGLAEQGIIAVTQDFPGCGASTESFRLNTQTNMKNDVLDVINYMQENCKIDTVSAMGYSMGGRIALELTAEEKFSFDKLEFVAPAEDLEDLKNLFGGPENWEVLKAKANEEGFAEYTTIYATQELSKEWFEDLEKYPDGLAEAAFEKFDGESFTIYAIDDQAVAPAVSQNVADIFGSPVINTQSGGHSYSFYVVDEENHPLICKQVNLNTIAFFTGGVLRDYYEDEYYSVVIPDGADMLKYGHIDIAIPADELLETFALGDTVTVTLEGYGSFDVPVCASYDDVAAGEMLLRAVSGKSYVILAINYGQIAVEQGIVEKAPEGAETAYVVKEGISFPINVTIEKKIVQVKSTVIPDGADMLKYGHIDIDYPADDFLTEFALGDTVTVELDGYGSFDVPVCASYDDVAAGEMLLRAVSGKTYLILAINYGQIAVEQGLVEKAPEGAETAYVVKKGVTFPIDVTITLKQKAGEGENILGNLIRTDVRTDYPELTDAQFANFRMVTTTGIGEGILYRSSSPINPEIGRNLYADAAAAAAGIKTFINLADTEAEATGYPDYATSYYSAQNHIFLGLPVAFTTDTFKSGLAEGFRYIINNEAPYLVHCTEGKDRAGLTSAILECLMGATYDEVIDDYVETYRNYYSVEAGAQRALTEKEEEAAAKVILANLKLSFGVEITETTDLAAAAETYMLSIGLTDTEIAALKTNLSGT